MSRPLHRSMRGNAESTCPTGEHRNVLLNLPKRIVGAERLAMGNGKESLLAGLGWQCAHRSDRRREVLLPCRCSQARFLCGIPSDHEKVSSGEDFAQFLRCSAKIEATCSTVALVCKPPSGLEWTRSPSEATYDAREVQPEPAASGRGQG